MGYPVYTKSLVCYIEANIMNGKLDYNELEKNIGYSKSYIREIFRNDMILNIQIHIHVVDYGFLCILPE